MWNNWSNYFKHLNSWDVDTPVTNGMCPFLPSDKPIVAVPLSLLFIARKSRRFTTEFIFYAKARENNNNIFIVEEDYCVPRQRATNVFVEAEPDCKGYNVVIHKHPEGVKHFSSVDDESINANNLISVLVESGKIVAAKAKMRLPCGAFYLADAEIVYIVPENLNITETERKAKEIIKEVSEKLEKYEPKKRRHDYYDYYHDYYRYLSEDYIYRKAEETEID